MRGSNTFRSLLDSVHFLHPLWIKVKINSAWGSSSPERGHLTYRNQLVACLCKSGDHFKCCCSGLGIKLMHQNDVPIPYLAHYRIYRFTGISRLPVPCIYTPHNHGSLYICKDRTVFCSSRRSYQGRSDAAGSLYRIIALVYLALDLGTA